MSAVSTVFFGFLLPVCITFAVQTSVFRSSSQEIIALVGNDVTMECRVSNLRESELVIWQNGSDVLSAGRKVYLPPEMNKASIESSSDDTFNLRIRNVTVYDAGNYSCQVAGRGTQYSQLVVHVPASIKFFPEGRIVTVVEESELSLTCIGYGTPKPVIQWIFHGKEKLQEMLENKGQETLMFSDIRRSKAGEYKCEATNGVGVPATHTIEVEVEYAPFPTITSPVIYVAPGQDVTIECFFSAKPDVDVVNWHHNNSYLKLNMDHETNMKDSHRKTNQHDVWSLDIRELRPDQLGLYSCVGENKIGTASDLVELSPLPHDLKILGVSKNRYSEQYTIRWTVSSPMKLLHFVISIKQQKDVTATTPYQREYDRPRENKLNDSFNLNWRDFSIPVSVPNRTPSHSQEYKSLELAVNNTYTIRMRAKNEYGYSDWSESITFHASEEYDEGPSQITTAAEFTFSNDSSFLRDSRGTFVEPRMSLPLILLAFLLLKNWDEVIH